jgi:hypothetical protein
MPSPRGRGPTIHERQGATLARLDAIDARLTGHARRIRRLEARWARVMGVFAAAGTAISAAWHYARGRT